MSEVKLSVEAKIKQIDEQIAMLSKLKSQYAEKLNDLSNEEVVIPKPADNGSSSNDQALLIKDYFRGREEGPSTNPHCGCIVAGLWRWAILQWPYSNINYPFR
jgi:hypothetical protein